VFQRAEVPALNLDDPHVPGKWPRQVQGEDRRLAI